MSSAPSFGGYHVVSHEQVPHQIKAWYKHTPDKYVWYQRGDLFCVKHESENKYVAVCEYNRASGYDSCDRDSGSEGVFLDGHNLEKGDGWKHLDEATEKWFWEKYKEVKNK